MRREDDYSDWRDRWISGQRVFEWNTRRSKFAHHQGQDLRYMQPAKKEKCGHVQMSELRGSPVS